MEVAEAEADRVAEAVTAGQDRTFKFGVAHRVGVEIETIVEVPPVALGVVGVLNMGAIVAMAQAEVLEAPEDRVAREAPADPEDQVAPVGQADPEDRVAPVGQADRADFGVAVAAPWVVAPEAPLIRRKAGTIGSGAQSGSRSRRKSLNRKKISDCETLARGARSAKAASRGATMKLMMSSVNGTTRCPMPSRKLRLRLRLRLKTKPLCNQPA